MNKIALVTGASRGVGRAAATYLSRKGYSVILCARQADDLAKVRNELAGDGHQIIQADLSKISDLNRLWERVREISGDVGLSAFIHCAATTPDPEAEATLGETLDETFDAHVTVTARSGPYLLGKLKPELAKAGRSNAILMSTDWAIDGIVGPPVFSSSKTFASSIWRHARAEYLKDGIILSAIVAGNIATYDESWSEPKWSLDDKIETVKQELGLARISLADIIGVMDLMISSPMAAITEVRIVPLDPAYVP